MLDTEPCPPPLRALLLEDEPIILIDIEATLSAAGYLVRTAHTCADALKLLDAEVFDIAVLDIGLPDGDCSAVATTSISRNIPVIFASGTDAAPSGFEGVPLVEKPYRDNALLEAMSGLLAMR